MTSPTVELLQAGPASIDILRDLLVQFRNEEGARSGSLAGVYKPAKLTEEIRQRLSSVDYNYRLLVANREVVGFTGFRRISGPIGEFTAVFILPSHRRKGLGRQAVLKTVIQMVAAGITDIRLEVHKDNEVSKKLLRDLGASLSPVSTSYKVLLPGYLEG